MAQQQLGKKDEIYGYDTYYRESGYFLAHREQYQRALKYFDQAISKTPDDIRALFGRSDARAKNIQYVGATDDIEKALKVRPGDFKLLTQKALNMYLSCDFENALVENLHHCPFRQKPDNFVMGIMHCTEAIENCVGVRAGKPLRDHYKIIRKLGWRAAFEAARPFQPQARFKKKRKVVKRKRKVFKQKPSNLQEVKEVKSYLSTDLSYIISEAQFKQHIPSTTSFKTIETRSEYQEEIKEEIRDSVYTESVIDDLIPPAGPFPFKPMQRHTTNLKNYMSEKYLGIMYLDKMFLEDMFQNRCLQGPNAEGVDKIMKLAKHGSKLLTIKQEILRNRRPFYFLRYQEATSTGTMKKRQEEQLKLVQEIYKREAAILLEKIINALRVGDVKELLEQAEKLKCYCDAKSKRVFNKDIYLKKMYELVCFGHYLLKRLNTEQTWWEQEARIAVMYGMPLTWEPSNDSVIKFYRQQGVSDYKKPLQIFEERLAKATSGPERTWLYHELARFYCETKNLDMARIYCRKCIQEAKNTENLRWMVNAYVLISKVYVMQKNKNDAKSEIYNAIEIGKLISDERLVDFLERCITVIEKFDFEGPDSAKLLEMRERQILNMLADAAMKGEAAYLFRKMSTLPASRRLSVMPGVKLPRSSKASSRRMSIRPSLKSEQSVVSSKRSSNIKEGTEFMKIIKFSMDDIN